MHPTVSALRLPLTLLIMKISFGQRDFLFLNPTLPVLTVGKRLINISLHFRIAPSIEQRHGIKFRSESHSTVYWISVFSVLAVLWDHPGGFKTTPP